MAGENLDLVAFLADYIYESSWGARLVRRHHGREPVTLADYRARHAQYKGDADLQRMHALAPWIVTWDDHEVDNDYASALSEHLDPNFLARRNPHVRFASSEKRGYVTVELTPARAQVALRTLDDASKRKTSLATQASFAIEDGRPGAQPA